MMVFKAFSTSRTQHSSSFRLPLSRTSLNKTSTRPRPTKKSIINRWWSSSPLLSALCRERRELHATFKFIDRKNVPFSNENRTFYGQAVNNALEQAHLKNVAKSMYSGGKHTGFSLCIIQVNEEDETHRHVGVSSSDYLISNVEAPFDSRKAFRIFCICLFVSLSINSSFPYSFFARLTYVRKFPLALFAPLME